MFLKFVFREQCWNENRKHACFIIDDPLLKKTYGFLNYRKLLKLMDEYNFHTSIAFIPYNWKRSKSAVTNLIKLRHYRYSLCYHGCYHTEKECGIVNEEELNDRFNIAKEMMRKHREKTGANHDNAFVFPQGCFSVNAMKVLKANNFLASINSEIFPCEGKADLKLSDLLDPVITYYSTFPLFYRRYARDINEFAFDLFLGKPILIVEHHAFLKDKYHKLTNFVNQINKIDKELSWDSLENIIKNTFAWKLLDKDTLMIKMFAKDAIITNNTNYKKKLYIVKNEDGNVQIDNILLNKSNLTVFTIKNDLLQFQAEIKPYSELRVEIEYKNRYTNGTREVKLIYKIGVFIRRRLSELRDNYLSKNEILLNIESLLKVFIKKFVP